MKRVIVGFFALMLMTTGCYSKFSCQETIDGIKCKNVHGVYEERIASPSGVYSTQVAAPTPKSDKDTGLPLRSELSEAEIIVRHLQISDPKPVRVPPIVLRIWTAPWEDADGDLHNAGYIYTEVDQRRGRWLFGEGAIKDKQTATKVFGSPSLASSQTPDKDTFGTGKDNKPDQYYGQKPPAAMPTLKFSK